MSMIDAVRSYLDDSGEVVSECRECGTSVENGTEECPDCGSGRIVRYHVD